MPTDRHLGLRQAVVDACRRMNATGVNQGTVGNVSARIDKGFVISPTGVPYDTLQAGQVVEMDLDGGYVGDWLPSSEWRIHAAIYGARPEAGAVVHTHAPHATALSCLRIEVPAFHYMIAMTGGASLRCADYATYGTPELAAAMLKALKGRTACLLANHGVVGFGPTLDRALSLVTEVDNLCRQYILARQAGEPVILDAAEMARVLEIFKSYGCQDAAQAPGGAVRRDRPSAVRRLKGDRRLR